MRNGVLTSVAMPPTSSPRPPLTTPPLLQETISILGDTFPFPVVSEAVDLPELQGDPEVVRAGAGAASAWVRARAQRPPRWRLCRSQPAAAFKGLTTDCRQAVS